MKKISALLLLSASLLLASCGGGEKPISSETPSEEPSVSSVVPSTTSEAPKSTTSETPKPSTTSETPKSTTSEAPKPSSSSTEEAEKTFAVAAADIVIEGGKAYLKLAGTIGGYANADAAKMAFGLVHKANNELGLPDAKDGQWLLGSETPAAADYKYAPTITGGNYEIKIDVSAIAFEKGNYTMWVGPSSNYKAISMSQGDYGAGTAEVNQVKLIFRGDQNLLVAEELPPVHLTEATIVSEVVDETTKVFMKVGGNLVMDAAAFQALTIKVTFERQVGGWKQFPKTGDAVTPIVEGTKGYVKVDITDLTEGGYQVKIGFDGSAAPNTVMECDSYDMRESPIEIGNLGYAPYFKQGGGNADTLYGCCGLYIQHAHSFTRGEAKVEGTDYYVDSCSCNPTAYEMDNDSTVCPGLGADKKMNSKKAATFNITGVAAGKYAVYLKGHTSNGNHTTSASVGFSTGAQMTTEGSSGGDPVPGRYYGKVGDADPEYTNTGDKNFNAIGWDDPNTFKWSNCAVIPSIMIAEGSTSFVFGHAGPGYSAYVETIRLVRLGDYVKPSVKLAETTTKIEAEDFYTKSNSNAGAITDDETLSGGKYVANLTATSSWGGTNYGEIRYNVKVLFGEAPTVKVKVHYKTTSGEGAAFSLVVDEGTPADLGTASADWTDVTSEDINLAYGEHVITLKGIKNVKADIDYIEITKQAAAA